MDIRKQLSVLHQRLGRSQFATHLAVRLRNQCSAVVAYHLAESGDHATNGEAELIRRIGPSVSRFVDVGANIGDITALVLASAPSSARGLLFEPSTLAAAKLRTRFEHAPGVELVRAAVSDVPGDAEFFQEPNAGDRSSLLSGYSMQSSSKVTVPVTTLDAEIERRGWSSVDFVKIDAEGYDCRVLLGARELLRAHRIGYVQFEYHWGWFRAGSTLAQASSLLDSLGYRVFLLKSSGLYELDYELYGEYGTYSNYVGIAPGRIEQVQSMLRGKI